MPNLDAWKGLSPKPRPLEKGEEWNVFLSYRSVNRYWVVNLYDVLKEQGHKVFLDQVVLQAGDELIRSLENALEKSQAGILIWSEESRDSDWVRREYEVMEAMGDKKASFKFVPVLLDASELPLFAKRRIFLNFSAYPDGPNGGELMRLLHSVSGEPLSEEATRFAVEQDELAKDANVKIRAALRLGRAKTLTGLLEEGGLPWFTSPALGCKVAEELTKLEECDAALEVLDEVDKRFTKAIRPKQLRSLALARRGKEGDLDKAQLILAELYEKGERDPETLGIFGRTWMDRFNDSNDETDLRESRRLYVEAFEGARDDYYTGINAAAKSVFLGDLDEAAQHAAKVEAIVGTEPVVGDYWLSATVAETALIKGDFAAAAHLYQAAVDIAPKESGSHRSTWGQASKLMAELGPSDAERAAIEKPFAHLKKKG